MFVVTLVVLSQVATPLVPEQPAAPERISISTEQGSAKEPIHWMIVTPILAGIAGAAAGVTLASEVRLNPGNDPTPVVVTGLLVGAAVGAGLGLVAGHFARRGSLAGKIASVALWVLGSGAVTSATAYAGVLALLFSSGNFSFGCCG